MSTALAPTERRLAWACVAATAAVALAWPRAANQAAWIGPTLALLPLLPLWLALIFRLAHPLYYAGLGMLFYFSHGAMELYVSAATRVYAIAEIGLCLAYFALLLAIRRRGKRAQTKLRPRGPQATRRDNETKSDADGQEVTKT